MYVRIFTCCSSFRFPNAIAIPSGFMQRPNSILAGIFLQFLFEDYFNGELGPGTDGHHAKHGRWSAEGRK
jgi:hypothetical protein